LLIDECGVLEIPVEHRTKSGSHSSTSLGINLMRSDYLETGEARFPAGAKFKNKWILDREFKKITNVWQHETYKPAFYFLQIY